MGYVYNTKLEVEHMCLWNVLCVCTTIFKYICACFETMIQCVCNWTYTHRNYNDYFDQAYEIFICRIRFPGFNLRVVCFNPNLQDLEGCMATPINQLFSTGIGKRSTSGVRHQIMSNKVDRAKREELMEQFINHLSPHTEQVERIVIML